MYRSTPAKFPVATAWRKRGPVSSMRDRKSTTSELQSHRDLHSFPTRRSSDLTAGQLRDDVADVSLDACEVPGGHRMENAGSRLLHARSEEHNVRTPVPPRSTLFPYTTLFRSHGGPAQGRRS